MKKTLIILITCFCLIITSSVYASSVTLSGNSSGKPNSTVKVTIKGDFTGRVNVSVTNGKVSKSSLWIENNSQTVTVTLGESGKTTITATPEEGTSDAKGNIISVAAKSKAITIQKATSGTNNNNNNNNNSNNNNNNNTAKKSTNANISRLTLSVEGLSFKTNQTKYNLKVGTDVDRITAKVTLESSKATYSISGNKNLKAGNNTIKIVVTAEAGNTKTYIINVEKEGDIEEISAELSNLIIENMTFNIPFASTETEYIGSKIKYTEKLNVFPYTVAEQATYEIIGNENFKEGENTIYIKVTSKDKNNTKEYKVTFDMMSKDETSALQVVNPYVDVNYNSNNKVENNNDGIKEALSEHSTIILLYLLALVEFAQVVYLYVQLKNINPEVDLIRRRGKNKEENN